MTENRKIVIRVRGIILLEDKLLVVKHPHNTGFFSLPGGKIKIGEDLKSCLKREIFEELGVESEIGNLLYVNNFTRNEEEQSMEFFFEIKNAEAFQDTEKLKGVFHKEIAEIYWLKTGDDFILLPEALGVDFKNNQIDLNKVKFINH